MTEDELKAIHQHSFDNRREIEASDLCGCFYCLEIYSPEIISDNDWYSTNNPPVEHTLFCPKCGIDSVIGSAAGYPLNKHWLGELNDYFFNSPPSDEVETELIILDLEEHS